jgi:hypothetical protein
MQRKRIAHALQPTQIRAQVTAAAQRDPVILNTAGLVRFND